MGEVNLKRFRLPLHAGTKASGDCRKALQTHQDLESDQEITHKTVPLQCLSEQRGTGQRLTGQFTEARDLILIK